MYDDEDISLEFLLGSG